MSFQKHFFRNEIWFVSRGNCYVRHSKQDSNKYDEILLKAEDFNKIFVLNEDEKREARGPLYLTKR